MSRDGRGVCVTCWFDPARLIPVCECYLHAPNTRPTNYILVDPCPLPLITSQACVILPVIWAGNEACSQRESLSIAPDGEDRSSVGVMSFRELPISYEWRSHFMNGQPNSPNTCISALACTLWNCRQQNGGGGAWELSVINSCLKFASFQPAGPVWCIATVSQVVEVGWVG